MLTTLNSVYTENPPKGNWHTKTIIASFRLLGDLILSHLALSCSLQYRNVYIDVRTRINLYNLITIDFQVCP